MEFELEPINEKTPLPPLITVVGTNASGKSALAVRLAKEFGGEVISADSRQVYRGLDLGSGKLTPEEMHGVPHHLIDLLEPGVTFSVADFQTRAYACITEIHARGRLPILAGGTGLYTRSVVQGYQLSAVRPDSALRERLEALSAAELYAELYQADPENAVRIDRNNGRRLVRALEKFYGGDLDFPARRRNPRYKTLQLGVTWPRPVLYARIADRLEARLKLGMVEEITGLLAQGVEPAFLEGLGLEYRFICRYLNGGYDSYEAFTAALLTAIRHFAKRQMTWFKAEPDIVWLDMSADYAAQARAAVQEFLATAQLE
jgi:tRNA dimethylallyltransferase